MDSDSRIFPLLIHINESAKKSENLAVVTVPGIGCGQFAGKFRGNVGKKLCEALKYIITKYSERYSDIACIYYDPFNECEITSQTIGNIKFRTRPSIKLSGKRKSQMCFPQEYEEDKNDDFSGCKLYKIVAWDHFSFPGNDYFTGSRCTDDGVAAAASSSMETITGIKGRYVKGKYLPPDSYTDWEEVVEKNNIKLIANGNVKIVKTDGSYLTLNEFEQIINTPPS